MTHERLLHQGKISQREYNELVGLKMRADNPAFSKESRKEARREYREREREYARRGHDSQMIRDMERRR